MDTERAAPSSLLISAVVRYWPRRSQIKGNLHTIINGGSRAAMHTRSYVCCSSVLECRTSTEACTSLGILCEGIVLFGEGEGF